MDRWFAEVDSNTHGDVATCLVGAKLDRAEASRAVPTTEGEFLAASHGAMFCEVSAKTRENVRKPFTDVVDRIVSTPQLLDKVLEKQRLGRRGTVDLNSNQGGWLPNCMC